MEHTNACLTSAKHWHENLAVPALSGEPSEGSQSRLVRCRGIGGRINQPALIENVLSVRLGGPKRMTRFQGRHTHVHDGEERFLEASLHRSSKRPGPKGGLAGWQLQRVAELIRHRLADDVLLGDLIAVTALSRSHVFRAIRGSTAKTPYAFLTDPKAQHAADALTSTRHPASKPGRSRRMETHTDARRSQGSALRAERATGQGPGPGAATAVGDTSPACASPSGKDPS